MILITDSGSTKCDWVALDNNGTQLFKICTRGMNPAILTKEELSLRILESKELIAHKDQVEQVFFYGAGCGTEMPRLVLEKVLSDYFLDEASGNWYGKNLLRDYGFKNMPNELMVKFAASYNLDPDYLKDNLYKKPNPNAFLASHAEFIFQNLEERYIKKLLRKGLRKFSRNMILQFREEIKSYEVHFVGSIAHFAQARIKQVSAEFGYELGRVVRKPIDGLVEYHRNKLLKR